MKYQIYSIYDNDLRQTSDLFLSANDETAKRTFEEHKRKLKQVNQSLNLDYLKIINVGEYDTNINVNYDSNMQTIVSIEPLVNGKEPYFVDNPPINKPDRLIKQEQDLKRSEFFKVLTGDKK